MILASPDAKTKTWFVKNISKWFQISRQTNDLTYLGMSVVKSPRGTSVNQIRYIETLGIKFGVDKDVRINSPTGHDFMEEKANDNPIDQSKFLSLVMSLMYLARFTRPDLLFPVTFMATKSASPKASHYHKLIRILGYAMATRHQGINFQSDQPLTLQFFADAAHMIHQDSKGHGGIIATMGGGPILSKSFKFKLITRSSAESELVCLEETVTFAIWIRNLVLELIPGFNSSIKSFQDNKSTMTMVLGSGSFHRSKHILNRHMFVKQYLDTKIIT
jgi:hypothetical protein